MIRDTTLGEREEPTGFRASNGFETLTLCNAISLKEMKIDFIVQNNIIHFSINIKFQNKNLLTKLQFIYINSTNLSLKRSI